MYWLTVHQDVGHFWLDEEKTSLGSCLKSPMNDEAKEDEIIALQERLYPQVQRLYFWADGK